MTMLDDSYAQASRTAEARLVAGRTLPDGIHQFLAAAENGAAYRQQVGETVTRVSGVDVTAAARCGWVEQVTDPDGTAVWAITTAGEIALSTSEDAQLKEFRAVYGRGVRAGLVAALAVLLVVSALVVGLSMVVPGRPL